MLTMEQIKTIFNNVEMISQVNSVLHEKLAKRYEISWKFL